MALYISGAAAEFSIAGRKHVGGDYYEFRRAPLVVKLPAGRHAIDVRVAHDVRAFGGVDSVKFRVEAAIVKGELSVGDGVMVSDVVSGRMVGEWVSVPVRNDGEGWIRVVSVLGKSVSVSFPLSAVFLTSKSGRTSPNWPILSLYHWHLDSPDRSSFESQTSPPT